MRHTRSLLALAGVSLLVCAISVHSLTVEPNDEVFTYHVRDPATGKVRTKSERRIAVTCEAVDFGTSSNVTITRPDERIAKVQVTCGTPVATYRQSQAGYVPRDGSYSRVRLCLKQDDKAPDEQENILRHTGSHWRNAQKLSIDEGHTHSMHPIRSLANVHESHRHLKPMFSLGGAASWANDQACRVGRGLDCNKGCPDCIRQEEFDEEIDRLDRAGEELNRRMDNYTVELERLNTNLVATDDKIADTQEQTLGIIETKLAAMKNQINVTEEITNHLVVLNRDLDQKFSRVDQKIKNSNIALGLLKDAASESDAAIRADLEKIANKTREAFIETNEGMEEFQNYTNTRLKRAGYAQRRLTSVVTEIVSTIDSMRRKVQDRRTIIDAVQTQISEAKGNNQLPFLKDEGQPPGGSTVGGRKVTIDHTQFRLVDAASTPIAHQWDVQFQCSRSWFLNSAAQTMGTERLLGTIGRPSCNPLSSTSVDTECRCWIRVEHRWCDAVGGGDPNSGFNMATWKDSTSDDISANSGWCATGTGSVSTDTLVSTASVSDYFGETEASRICRPSSDGHDVEILNSYPLERRVAVRAESEFCDIWSLEAAANPSPDDPITFMAVYLHNLKIAWHANYRQLEPARRELFGTMPDGLTVRTNDFAMDNGEDASCSEVSFMSYDVLNPLPVRRIDPVKLEAALQVTTFCCADDNYAASSTRDYTNPITDFGMIFALPKPGTLLVGDLENDASKTYDVPDNAISVGPVPSTRAGTVAYAVATEADDIGNFSKWIEVNGQRPNAEDGAAVASLYEVDNTATNDGDVICQPNRPVSTGGMCSVLDNFAVSYQPSGGDLSSMLFKPRTGRYRAVVTAPEGDISKFLTARCPSLTLGIQTSTGRMVQMHSPADTTDPLLIRYKVTPVEACSFVDFDENNQATSTQGIREVTLNEGETREVWVPACDGLAEGEEATFTVYRFDGNEFLECDGQLRMTKRDTFYTEFAGQVDVGTVQTRVLSERDRTTESFSKILTKLIELQTTSTMNMVSYFDLAGIPAPVNEIGSTLSSTDDVYDEVTEVITGLLNQTGDDTNYTWDNSDNLLQILDDINESRSIVGTAEDQLDDARGTLNETRVLINQSFEILDELKESRLALLEALADFTNASVAVARETLQTFVRFADYNAEQDSLLDSVLGIDMGDVASGIGNIISATPNALSTVVEGVGGTLLDGAGSVVDFVEDRVDDAIDLAEAPFRMFESGKDFLQTMIKAAVILAIIALVYVVYQKVQESRDNKNYQRQSTGGMEQPRMNTNAGWESGSYF